MRQALPVHGNGTSLQLIPAEALIDAKHVAPTSGWNRERVPAEAILEVWSAEPCNAEMVLYAATAHPMRFEPLELIVEGDRLVSKAPHRLATGDGPFYASDGTPVWVQRVDAKSLLLCSSLDALLGGGTVGIPAAVARQGGTTLVDAWKQPSDSPAAITGVVTGPQRLCWSPIEKFSGKFGPQEGLSYIVRHTPRTLAYALVGTPTALAGREPGGKTVVVRGALWPLREV